MCMNVHLVQHQIHLAQLLNTSAWSWCCTAVLLKCCARLVKHVQVAPDCTLSIKCRERSSWQTSVWRPRAKLQRARALTQ